jgi:hypothetical protein
MASFAQIWKGMRDAGHAPPYLLLDGAGFEQGAAAIPRDSFEQLECLFTGDLAEELADVAPYLARVASWDEGAEATVDDLLARDVAVLVLPPLAAGEPIGFSQLHRHFRKLNVVYGSEGQPLFFRYYDPRVLVDVLSVLEAKQLNEFFGPVDSLLLVQADRQLVRCYRQDGTLVVQPT